MRSGGFTLIEVMVVIIVIAVLFGISLTNFALQKKKIDLNGNAQEVANVLNLAQSKTLASIGSSQYGVYFDNVASPNKYILFKGANYVSRDASLDIIYSLPSAMEFSLIVFGSGNEVVFDKLTGTTAQSGKVVLRIKQDTSQSKDIYISSSGSVNFSNPLSGSDDDRQKDSRHVHFDYNRPSFMNCPAANAILYLYFDGASSPQQTVSFCDNLANGQLNWTGTVSIGGSEQTVAIHTHYLQDINYQNGTQFSIHRDGRLNNKSLIIKISGDSSNDLINYSSDGLNTTYTSIYVSNLAWQ